MYQHNPEKENKIQKISNRHSYKIEQKKNK